MLMPIVVAGLIIAGLFFAATRRGTVQSVGSSSRVEMISVRMKPAETYARLVAGVDGFRIDDSDESLSSLVLSTPPTFATWGFFYPVTISMAPDGSSLVSIGIKSKLIQWGPLVTRWHRKCRAAVELTISGELPSARVVVDSSSA